MSCLSHRLFRWCNGCHFLLMFFETIGQWMVVAIKRDMAVRSLGRQGGGIQLDTPLIIGQGQRLGRQGEQRHQQQQRADPAR